MSRITNRFVTSGSATAGQVLTADGAGNSNWTTAGSNPTGAYAQAYFASASSWSTTNTTYNDGTNAGGNALTVRQSSGITLTAAASNVCGITFTPASASAVYLISVNFGITADLAYNINTQLTDGTTVISRSSGMLATASGVLTTTLTGIFVPGTGSPVTVKIQFETTAGTATIQANGGSNPISVEWTIVRIA